MTNDTITEQSALTAVVDAYVASWNESDPTRRTALVEQAWTPEARYVDPLLDLTGHEQLGTLAPLLEQHYPGHSIKRTSDVDAHHGYARFSWELNAPDGAVVISGIDVCAVADDGRLNGIAGFFDQ
jgi:SnoaL-like domain